MLSYFNGFLTSGRMVHKFPLVSMRTQPDHVRVQSSSCCFPRELVSSICPRELVSFNPWHETRSPPVGKLFELGGIIILFIP